MGRRLRQDPPDARLLGTGDDERWVRRRSRILDVEDTITRLQACEAAGADVLYAPCFSRPEDLRRILDSVSLPVNVLALPDTPGVAELAALGVARISVGTGFFLAAVGGLVTAGRELLDKGTYGFWAEAGVAGAVTGHAFS